MKPKTLAKKRLAFLEETINHFNSQNRGLTSFGSNCSYSAGCAIGRKLKSKKLKEELDSLSNPSVDNPFIFEKLPKTLQCLGAGFLKSMQQLHDNAENWDRPGLSSIGKSQVKIIKDKWDISIWV